MMAGNTDAENNANKRLNNWLLEYSYWYTWEEFSKTRKVDVDTTRDFVQWILTQVDQNSMDYNTVMKSLILGALCMLSDGNDYSIRYSGDSDLTVLEVLLQTFQNICEQVPTTLRQTFLDFIPTIKLQAVIVCCDKGDFDSGVKVFERQWENSTTDEALKKQIKQLLKSSNTKDRLIKNNSYDGFLDKIVALLKKINEGFSQPFLLKLAKQMEEVDKTKPRNKRTVGLKRTYQSSDIEKLDDLSNKKLSKLSNEKEIALKNKLVELQELKISSFVAKGLSAAKQGYNEDSNSDVSDTEQGNFNRSAHNRSADVNEEKRRSLTTRLINKDEDLRNVIHDFRKPVVSRKPVIESQLKRKWNSVETEEFYQAVQKFGVGNWAVIKENLNTFRTNVKLKDKWRTINNTGEIEQLKKKFGPV